MRLKSTIRNTLSLWQSERKKRNKLLTQKSLADIRARAEKVKEGYVSMAQQRAVWATRKDGGKGHPDNKKKIRKKMSMRFQRIWQVVILRSHK